MPKIGVYIPAWKAGKYIADSIKSIKSQTFEDWQLVIIDDHSPDHTMQAALDATEGDSRIIVKRRTEHSGRIGKIKNEAIKQLEPCEFICHVGSDDLIPNYCFQAFVVAMDAHPEAGAACGSFIAFDDTGRKWKFPHVERDKGFDRQKLLSFMNLYPMRFYRREIVEKVGGYSNDLSSAVDYDLALKLDEITKIIRIFNPPTYFYRQHMEQVSSKKRAEQNANAKRALQDALIRRGIEKEVENDAPPFSLTMKSPKHFIWGAK